MRALDGLGRWLPLGNTLAMLVIAYDRRQGTARSWGEPLGCWQPSSSPSSHMRGRGVISHYMQPARTITTARQHASHHSWLLRISTRFLWLPRRIVAVRMNQAPPAAGGHP